MLLQQLHQLKAVSVAIHILHHEIISYLFWQSAGSVLELILSFDFKTVKTDLNFVRIHPRIKSGKGINGV